MPSAWNTIHHRGNKVFFTEEIRFFSQRNREDAFGMMVTFLRLRYILNRIPETSLLYRQNVITHYLGE
jgi:hypothetical protein